METNKILSADVLDIVFEGRNKDYGAYELRRSYNRRIGRALIITGSIAALALIGSYLSSAMSASDKDYKIDEVNIQNIQEKKDEPPPPPPPPPPPKPDPPKVEMKQFTPPVIKKDEEVDQPPPEQKELEDVKIDVKNEEGVKDAGIEIPPDIVKKEVIEEKPQEDENKIFEKVEVEAAFPGGDVKWRQYLTNNLRADVPIENQAPEGTYTTVIQFVVDKEGNISDVRAMTNHGYGMEQEAIRVIQKGPKWTPAIQNGRQVKAYRKQPITFQVQGE